MTFKPYYITYLQSEPVTHGYLALSENGFNRHFHLPEQIFKILLIIIGSIGGHAREPELGIQVIYYRFDRHVRYTYIHETFNVPHLYIQGNDGYHLIRRDDLRKLRIGLYPVKYGFHLYNVLPRLP